jgi:hypothetical protein
MPFFPRHPRFDARKSSKHPILNFDSFHYLGRSPARAVFPRRELHHARIPNNVPKTISDICHLTDYLSGFSTSVADCIPLRCRDP